MSRYILVDKGQVVSSVVTEDVSSISGVIFDTIILDDKTLFDVGDIYTIEEFNTRNFNILSEAEQLQLTRDIMTMTRFNAEASLIAHGLLLSANKAVFSLGSKKLQYVWRTYTQTYRMCQETVELTEIMGISDTLMDSVFMLGMSFDEKLNSSLMTAEQHLRLSQYKKKEYLLENQTLELDALLSAVAIGEMESFTIQAQEAKAWHENKATITPFIDNLLNSRNFGETKEELVGKILAKANVYSLSYAQILGKFQALIKQVENATSYEVVEAIVW